MQMHRKEERYHSANVWIAGELFCFSFRLSLLLWGGSGRGTWALNRAAYSAWPCPPHGFFWGKEGLWVACLIRAVGNQVPWSEAGRGGELVQREGNLAAQPLFSYCPWASIRITCKLFSTAVSESESGVITRLLANSHVLLRSRLLH